MESLLFICHVQQNNIRRISVCVKNVSAMTVEALKTQVENASIAKNAKLARRNSLNAMIILLSSKTPNDCILYM